MRQLENLKRLLYIQFRQAARLILVPGQTKRFFQTTRNGLIFILLAFVSDVIVFVNTTRLFSFLSSPSYGLISWPNTASGFLPSERTFTVWIINDRIWIDICRFLKLALRFWISQLSFRLPKRPRQRPQLVRDLTKEKDSCEEFRCLAAETDNVNAAKKKAG